MDEELERAIAESLKEEQRRMKQTKLANFPSVYEVHHCNKSVFTFTVPDRCRVCGAQAALPQKSAEEPNAMQIDEKPEKEEATTTQQDVVKVVEHRSGVETSRPRCIAIKPTLLAWNKYTQSCHLHCGVSDSKGLVYNFDQRGCTIEKWPEVVNVLIYAPNLSDEEWDKELARHNDAESTFVSFRPYHELRNNCYDYVIRFLNAIKFEGRDNHTSQDIVDRYIQRGIDHFEGFLAVYKEVNKRGVYEAESGLPKTEGPTRHVCNVCAKVIDWYETRHRCMECADYDLCQSCQAAGKVSEGHKTEHKLFKLEEKPAKYSCDVCSKTISSPRVHCLDCEDYDLCMSCHSTGKTNGSHKATHATVKV